MKLGRTDVFVRSYARLSPPIRKRVDAALLRLATDIRHPSLRVRKLVNSDDIYEARVDFHYRITFQKRDDTLVLRKVGTHEIYRQP